MSAISGPSFDVSSPSADLQRCLESKYRARADVNGSPEYVLTWKRWDMPSGPSILALRARARRTSDSAFGGWPTPAAREPGGTWEQELERKRACVARGIQMGMEAVTHLSHAVQLVGWPTAKSTDADKGIRSIQGADTEFKRMGTGSDLPTMVTLVGWATPSTTDTQISSSEDQRVGQLGAQTFGLTSSSSPAATARPGVLNPAFSRWLMGFPEGWDRASPGYEAWRALQDAIASGGSGGTGMRLSRHSQRRSSGRSSKRNETSSEETS